MRTGSTNSLWPSRLMPLSIAWLPHQSLPSSLNFFVLLTKFDLFFYNVLKETEDWDMSHLAKNTVLSGFYFPGRMCKLRTRSRIRNANPNAGLATYWHPRCHPAADRHLRCHPPACSNATMVACSIRSLSMKLLKSSLYTLRSGSWNV